jgi:hypothetical protein
MVAGPRQMRPNAFSIIEALHDDIGPSTKDLE